MSINNTKITLVDCYKRAESLYFNYVIITVFMVIMQITVVE